MAASNARVQVESTRFRGPLILWEGGIHYAKIKTAEWFDWLCHDKGYGRRLRERSWDTAPMPVGFGTLGEHPNVTAAMERRGWAETRIRKVHGENWLRVLGEVWGS